MGKKTHRKKSALDFYYFAKEWFDKGKNWLHFCASTLVEQKRVPNACIKNNTPKDAHTKLRLMNIYCAREDI